MNNHFELFWCQLAEVWLVAGLFLDEQAPLWVSREDYRPANPACHGTLIAGQVQPLGGILAMAAPASRFEKGANRVCISERTAGGDWLRGGCRWELGRQDFPQGGSVKSGVFPNTAMAGTVRAKRAVVGATWVAGVMAIFACFIEHLIVEADPVLVKV